MTDLELVRVIACTHEAAHAVIARALGIPIKRVVVDIISVSPTGLIIDGKACATMVPALRRARKGSKAKQIAELEKDALALFAGIHAGIKIGAPLAGGEEDFRDIRRKVLCIAQLSSAEIEESIQTWRRLSDSSRELVHQNWDTICRVAARLLSQPVISGRQLDKILKEDHHHERKSHRTYSETDCSQARPHGPTHRVDAAAPR